MLMNSFYIFHQFNNNAFFWSSVLPNLFDDSYVSSTNLALHCRSINYYKNHCNFFYAIDCCLITLHGGCKSIDHRI